jgi:hypothetical protein
MTATNVLCLKQRREVRLTTDGAVYDMPSGIVRGIGTKVFPIAHWPGVVTGRGTSIAVVVLGQELSWRFDTFDDAVEGAESLLPGLVENYRIRGAVELVIAGWSTRAQEPQAYVIETTDDLPFGMTADELDAHEMRAGMILPPSFSLTRLDDDVHGPVLTADVAIANRWKGHDLEAPVGDIIQACRHTVECQRLLTQDGLHLVGGFIEHTVITRDSVSQRILHRWPEDTIGRPIEPGAHP